MAAGEADDGCTVVYDSARRAYCYAQLEARIDVVSRGDTWGRPEAYARAGEAIDRGCELGRRSSRCREKDEKAAGHASPLDSVRWQQLPAGCLCR